MSRRRASLAALALLALGACAAPERASAPPSAATPKDDSSRLAVPEPPTSPYPRWPEPSAAIGLEPHTLLAIRETRRVEGVENESSELRVRWRDIDAQGRGRSADIVVHREQRGRGAELRSTPNEGRRFAIEERSGALRLLSGSAPSFTDETDRQPALFARALASGGHGALRPEEPRAIGERWSVPLGRYLAEAGLAGAPSFEGSVSAERRPDRDGRIAIAFEVALQTPERFRRDASLSLRGEVLFDPRLGLAISKQSSGILREESRELAIEVETQIEVLAVGRDS
ncbi:MAG: hypothetical protein JNM84_24980 [Planctomycetes bacterium]|nr:hypothetical protein [Planctomycetota bacterium]